MLKKLVSDKKQQKMLEAVESLAGAFGPLVEVGSKEPLESQSSGLTLKPLKTLNDEVIGLEGLFSFFRPWGCENGALKNGVLYESHLPLSSFFFFGGRVGVECKSIILAIFVRAICFSRGQKQGF